MSIIFYHYLLYHFTKTFFHIVHTGMLYRTQIRHVVLSVLQIVLSVLQIIHVILSAYKLHF